MSDGLFRLSPFLFLGLGMLDQFLLAEGAGVDLPAIGTGLLNLTGTGFAVWFGYQTVTKTIPDIMKGFREEMKTEREFHQEQRERDFQFHQEQVSKLLTKVEANSCRHPTVSQNT